jgi:hypothetical protein
MWVNSDSRRKTQMWGVGPGDLGSGEGVAEKERG